MENANKEGKMQKALDSIKTPLCLMGLKFRTGGMGGVKYCKPFVVEGGGEGGREKKWLAF